MSGSYLIVLSSDWASGRPKADNVQVARGMTDTLPSSQTKDGYIKSVRAFKTFTFLSR
jgi:hypothetical protein